MLQHHHGTRRLDLVMLTVRDRADGFAGVPAGSRERLRFLAAFEEAEPYLGLPVHASKLVRWLVNQTRDCDWEAGSRPIAWPSARREQELLGLSPRRVKTLNRVLFGAGIFVMRDHPTGKRFGRRGPDGRIIEAYGFDLSPIALRHDEFVRIAAEAAAERERMRKLRTRATIARKAVAQAGEALAKLLALPDGWPRLKAETAGLVIAAKKARASEALSVIVVGLEARKDEVEQWLRDTAEPVETPPLGGENAPLHTNTDTDLGLIFTVEAAEVCSREAASRCFELDADTEVEEQAPAPFAMASDPPPIAGEGCQVVGPEGRDPAQASASVQAPALSPERLSAEVAADELVDLAPRLGQWVPPADRRVTWSDIADGAGPLCTEIGVPHRLWVEACAQMGVHKAAIALAIVASKPENVIHKSYAAYFTGMIRRHEAGALNLERSLWKLRRDSWKGTRH